MYKCLWLYFFQTMMRRQIQEGTAPNNDSGLHAFPVSVSATASVQCLGGSRKTGTPASFLLGCPGVLQSFFHGAAERLTATQVPGRKSLHRISSRECSDVVRQEEPRGVLSQLTEGCLGSKSGQFWRDPCLCDKGPILGSSPDG